MAEVIGRYVLKENKHDFECFLNDCREQDIEVSKHITDGSHKDLKSVGVLYGDTKAMWFIDNGECLKDDFGCEKYQPDGHEQPKPNADESQRPIVAMVMEDLIKRMEKGVKDYGQALRANNGRNALQDAYEEVLDLACYIKQAMGESENGTHK